jgi:hypothetical protein
MVTYHLIGKTHSWPLPYLCTHFSFWKGEEGRAKKCHLSMSEDVVTVPPIGTDSLLSFEDLL